MSYRPPYEVLASFKPRRGALHLGNFASMGALPEKQSFVDVVSKMKTDAYQRVGPYPGAPRTPAIPLTTLSMAMVVSKLIADVMPKAWQVANDAPDNITLMDFIKGEGRVGQSLARAVKRWNEARFKFMSRPWETLGKTWAEAENFAPFTSIPGVDPLKIATTPLTYEEAAFFWDEAARIAIDVKVLLDRPHESKWQAAYDAIHVDISWAIDLFAGAVESVVKYGIEAILKILTALGKGAGRGIWAGLGPVLSVVAVGGLGYWAWRTWGHKLKRRTT